MKTTHRKFEFIIEFDDCEGPDETNETSIKALKKLYH